MENIWCTVRVKKTRTFTLRVTHHKVVFPHTRAIALFQPNTANGKLNADITPTTPSGFHISSNAWSFPEITDLESWFIFQSGTEKTVYVYLHCELAVAQCIVIGPVCGCVCVCGVDLITQNCMHRSSPNWVCR